MPIVSGLKSGSGPGPRSDPAASWSLAGASLALVLAAAALAWKGLDRAGLELALRLTARLAFFAFWPCYAAGALVVLFGDRFAPLKRRARTLGLTFAAVLAVHLSLVATLVVIGHPPSAQVFAIFGPGAICALLLAAASLDRVSKAIGARGWWLLRNVGMNYIALDFILDFTRNGPLLTPAGLVEYLPFAAFAVGAPALRLAAWFKQRRAKHISETRDRAAALAVERIEGHSL